MSNLDLESALDEYLEESSSDESPIYNSSHLLMPVCMPPPVLECMLKGGMRQRGGSIYGRRVFNREREEDAQKIWDDYFAKFPTYPPEYFYQRFCMRRDSFIRILRVIEVVDPWFVQREDACKILGLTSIQEMTTAVRMLAYGCPADSIDEYIRIGESIALESLAHFCRAMILVFGAEYLRFPNEEEVARLLKKGESRGFPGSHNDLNVLDHSPLFDDLINDNVPKCDYDINGHNYTMGYYLMDGIYPKWSTLLRSIAQPSNEKERVFVGEQEAVRKVVERAFGVFQIRWAITQLRVRLWKKFEISCIMKTCIILHNITIEDERDPNVEAWQPLPNEVIPLPQLQRNP